MKQLNNTVAKVPHILIVDDEVEQCQELSEFLNNHGLPAKYVTDSRDAVAHIEAENPRAVLLDINMPTMDGIRVLELIVGLGYRGGIVVMSGNPDLIRKAWSESIISNHCLHILEKPIDSLALKRYAEVILNR